MSQVKSSNILEKQLDLLSEKVNQDIYEQRKYLLGRILTVVDAVASDPEQRKAIKDVIQDLFHQGSYWNNIKWHFNEIKKANDIKPKEDSPIAVEPMANIYEQV